MPEMNVFDDEWSTESDEPGFRHRRMRIAAERLGASVYELPPGERTWPYHYELGQDELLVVIAGQPTLRDPSGERVLRPGDTVIFPSGPDGAHQLINRTDHAVRVLLVSNLAVPKAVVYPDSNKLMVRWGVDDDETLAFRREDSVDYWEGEQDEQSQA